MMCFARFCNSDSASAGERRGSRPDLESSPEVLICMRTFNDVVRSGDIYLLRDVAVLVEANV